MKLNYIQNSQKRTPEKMIDEMAKIDRITEKGQ